MSAESTCRPARRRTRCAALTVAAMLMAGCTALSSVGPAGGAAHEEAAASGPNGRDPVVTVLTFHAQTRALAPTELARQRVASTALGNNPLALMQRALLHSRPPGGNIARAIALFEAVMASDHPEAPALQPLARLLADQLLERHRLEAVNDRLVLQLERTGQQLKDSQRQADQLQEKLEALTEIERTLPARPPAPPPSPATTPERRSSP
jgi:hypothetical protein